VKSLVVTIADHAYNDLMECYTYYADQYSSPEDMVAAILDEGLDVWIDLYMAEKEEGADEGSQ
jgi:hypothetical protein